MPDAPLHDWEDPDPDDQDDPHSLDRGTMDCPHCRAEIDEEAIWCPTCGEMIQAKDSPRTTKTLLIIAAVIAVTVLMLVMRS